MRRWIGIISIAMALVAMHGGKWAAYALCRVQMTVVLQQADCDCAKVLNAADDQPNDGRDMAAGLLEPSTELFGCTQCYDLLFAKSIATSSGTKAFLSPLFAGMLQGVFRPPAA